MSGLMPTAEFPGLWVHAPPGKRNCCPAVPLRPCQHCGTPTRHRSQQTQGWPACPDCHTAWEQRPEVQRRRAQAVKAIARRESDRRKARRTRRYLEAQGFSTQAVAAVAAGGLIDPGHTPDP